MKTKTLFLLSFIAIFITSCGSDKKNSYTISDDNNGTRSPRIQKVIYRTADGNKSLETITQYTYDNNNLLISKKMSYSQNKKDIKELTFTYNDKKQYVAAEFRYPDVGIYRVGSSHKFFYGDILYKNTTLPTITLETTSSPDAKCDKEYFYNIDSNNSAISIDKIETSCTGSYSEGNKYIDTFDYYKNGMIKTVNHSDRFSKNITYTAFNKIDEITWDNQKSLYVYNKDNLLTSIKLYTKQSGTYTLKSTQTIKYENKKYYNKHVPNSIDFSLFESNDLPFIFMQ